MFQPVISQADSAVNLQPHCISHSVSVYACGAVVHCEPLVFAQPRLAAVQFGYKDIVFAQPSH
jgi:hypothetical protein